MNKNFELSARSNELSHVLKNTICTNNQEKINSLESSIDHLVNILKSCRDRGGAVYLIGNGGSSAVASHAITDFINVCRFRAFTLHESSLITCMANDFGYEHAYETIVSTVMRAGDVLIAISSSGKSKNICNAANKAKALGGTVITFTGFNANNTLRQLGDLNFWLDSSDFGIVEIGHLFILHNISDRMHIQSQQIHLTEKAEELVVS